MHFLLSGEGATDLGVVEVAGTDQFRHGPMAIVVDRLVEARHGYSPINVGVCRFVPESALAVRAKSLRPISLPGSGRRKETAYYRRNARALAQIAGELAARTGDVVVAILFRDADGTASAGRGEWADKVKSMLEGFEQEGFGRGVPMIPRPKSEAWLLCAMKADAFQHCDSLEERSGNDASPRSLKGELADLLASRTSREELNDAVAGVDWSRLMMPSFVRFREALEKAIIE